ncbi:hypothetical protein MSSIT_1716 [Methanosarcina siciliae T4/M]|uniref:Cell surface protein n=1 Tax=Methanosarcina siciliae T4/M TaxID=1434120 RepID=A0A0E3P4D5_9EURY|nr:PKD domain-containing protein [Methanosarcina siciliae]AKB28435.1 hypothetical protein MSSIT_1716 [Methanosarcina siciliae T4/M]
MEINRQLIYSLIFVAFLVTITGTALAPEVDMEQVGHLAGNVCGVAVSGNYVYVADYNNGLVIVDISNPYSPSIKGSYSTAGNSEGVSVSGNYACVADGYNGLVIVDIGNPSSPVITGSYDTAGYAYGVSVSGNYAYVADYNNGLVIVDVSNPSSPFLKGSCNSVGLARGVSVSGNYAYVAANNNRFAIVDISNPSSPTLNGSYDTAGNADGVSVSGNYAYVANGYNGLLIFDVGNPSSLIIEGNYDTAGYARGISVSGNYAYVTDWSNGLLIFDISNPSSPILEKSYDTAGGAQDVAVSGNYAYVADWNNGLVILKTNLEKPVLPIANFSTNVTSGYAPLCVQFLGSSLNTTGWNWDFGDGNTSNEQSPIHTYSVAGPYTVNLTTSNANGTNSKLATISLLTTTPVYYSGNGHYYDVISATGGITWGDANTTAQSLSYSVMNGHLVTITSQDENDFIVDKFGLSDYWLGGIQPAGSSEPAGGWQWVTGEPWVYTNWDYGGPSNSYWGGYSINLPNGYPEDALQFHGNSRWNDVPQECPVHGYIVEYEAVTNSIPELPLANFSTNLSKGYAPLTVQFNDSSLNVALWNWDFGDGNTSFEQSPMHTYSAAGTYTANLTVSNTNGTSSKTAIINVSALVQPIFPVANFTANVTKGYAPLSVQFNDSSLNATAWNWDFGDGVNSTQQSPIHTYFAVGKYTVKLTVSNTNGTDSKSATITVFPKHTENYTFVSKWGYYGGGDGQFNLPYSVAVDSSGGVYVDDYINRRIQKFDSEGTFLTKWGSYGSGDGQFDLPYGVAVDSSDNVYVGDMWNHRIQKFDSEGTFLTKWGSYGSDDGQLHNVCGVAVDSSGNVYAADTENNRIQKFDSEGTFLSEWGYLGSGNGQFDHPHSVAADPSGYVYVADTYNHRIQKFDNSGNFITRWGYYGSSDGQFSRPYGIAVDSLGNVYVADTNNHRIQKFDSNGTFLAGWGSYGSNDGQLIQPFGVTADSSGNVYVADTYNHRIQKFTNIPKQPPSANFSSNVTYGYVPLSVQFSDSSLNATAWNWDFGDGVNSTQQGPMHTYVAVGNYTVNLTVSNAIGNDSKLATITVLKKPVPVLPEANFSANVSEGYAPLSVQFTYLSKNVTQWNWNFGDGSSNVSDANPEHIFTSPGLFNVVLTASNGNGSDSKSMTINVTSKPVLPVANFSNNVTEGYAPLDVQFTDLSQNATEWSWDFGDGDNSTQQSPMHTYVTAGNYTVNLTVSNANGTDSKLATITAVMYSVPPLQSISNLQSSTGSTWINWTWTNPTDPDFNHTEIYLNGTFQTNTSAEYFNATGLQPETGYRLSTRTADINGNLNETWVNATATTGAESVTENFNVSISTDKPIYDREETVHITGKAQYIDGSPVVNAPALLNLKLKGYTQTYSLVTDSDGYISYYFNPGHSEAGNFTAKLSVKPNKLWISAETSFDMYGLYMIPSGIIEYEMSKNSSENITFSLRNYGETDLHGVTVQLDEDTISGVETRILQMPPETLVAGAEGSFKIKISSENVDVSQANYTVRITTDEGSSEEAKLFVYLVDASPAAIVSPTSIVVGLNPNNILVKTVDITNAGYKSMNDINISKPALDWVSVSSANLGNISPGMNKSFNVFFNPGNDTSVGVYQETITISSSNHPPVSINLVISVTSSEKGDLMFHVVNDIGQNIPGASVVIQNPAVLTEIFQGTADENGYYLFENISVGTYNYFIKASDHAPVSGSSTVSPGIQTLAEPVLSKNILGVKLTVTPIQIEDDYDIKLNLTFETDVPPPLLIPDPMYIKYGVNFSDPVYETDSYITISNPGLISIFNVTVDSSSLQGVNITFPTGNTFFVDELKPQSSITIPYHLKATNVACGGDEYRNSIRIGGNYLTFEPNSDITHEVYLSSEIPVFIYMYNCPVGSSVSSTIVDYFKYSYSTPRGSYSPITIEYIPKVVETVHERVKLYIPQKATLERDAFAASLELTNKLTDQNIESVSVNLKIKDKNGKNASGLFFVSLTALDGINSIDGNGVMSPSAVVSADWLLVPEKNAGGTTPLGEDYTVQAFINYTVNGVPFSTNSTEENITVMPQPLLNLTYTIPDTVKADKPFNLTLTVNNVGYGTAKNLKLDSGQPMIYENKAGLLVSFELIGSGLVDGPETDSLLIDFGDVAPRESKEAYWIMTSSLDGEFTEFKGSFSHSNALGGAETSLINDIKYIIIKELDTNPPSSITNLQSTSESTWINWTWNNPSDPDFSHTEIYLNGAFQTSTSAKFFNATGLEPETEYTISTRTVDVSGNINETWVNSTATTLAELVSDTEKPVIESVVLFPATTTAGSTINVTVDATDNIEVTEVTAGDVQLAKTDNIWQGSITAPSSIGDYSMLITAKDAAGNAVEITENYKVVAPTGSLGVGISPKVTTASTSGTTIDYTVNIKSIQNFDDIVSIDVIMGGLPASYQISSDWFEWNNQTVNVPANSTVSLPLKLTIPPGQAASRKAFKVRANSTLWITSAYDTGVIAIS